MQELIRKVEILQVADAVIDPLGIVKMFATELLETEREQIEQGFVDGTNRGMCGIPFNCELYYSQKFKK